MALYSDKVMDHFQNPRNVGKMDDADGIGEVGNAKCGDIMRMYIKVEDGVITDCKFNTFGFVQEKKKRMSFHDTLKLLAKCLPNLPNSISCSFMSIA